MPSDKCSNLITAKATVLIFLCLLAYCSMYNAFFMNLLVSSFVSHSSLLTAKGVELVVAHDGFPSKWKSSVFFIVATLIAEVLFEQYLICYAV